MLNLVSDKEVVLLEKYGIRKSQYRKSCSAEIYIDKLIELSRQKEIKFIDIPQRPTLE